MIDRDYEEFLRAVKSVFTTKDGKTVIKYLKSDYVDTTSLGKTPEETYYKLGRRDMVQQLLTIIDDPRSIDEIIRSITNITNEV